MADPVVTGSRPTIWTAKGDWQFANPVRIRFGDGRLDDLARLELPERVLLVTTPGFTRRGVTDRVRALIGEVRVVVYDEVEPNPSLDVLDAAAAGLEGKGIGAIAAVGGGSAMDTAKALAFRLAPGHEVSLAAHFRDGVELPAVSPLPVIAVPTTAGTGSEVTPFATIWDRAQNKKYSLAGERVFPHTAILDPLLTIGLPESETVASGLDALSQGLESIWNRSANPVTVSYATRAVALALETLPGLVRDLSNAKLRRAMMEASLLAGLAISSTRTALAHSMSYPLTAHYGTPHGLACSFTLSALCAYNAREDDGRLDRLGRELGLDGADGLVVRLRSILRELRVGARVRETVPGLEAVLSLAPEMFTPGRADNNLAAVDRAAIESILVAAWGDVVDEG